MTRHEVRRALGSAMCLLHVGNDGELGEFRCKRTEERVCGR